MRPVEGLETRDGWISQSQKHMHRGLLDIAGHKHGRWRHERVEASGHPPQRSAGTLNNVGFQNLSRIAHSSHAACAERLETKKRAFSDWNAKLRGLGMMRLMW